MFDDNGSKSITTPPSSEGVISIPSIKLFIDISSGKSKFISETKSSVSKAEEFVSIKDPAGFSAIIITYV